MFMWKLQLGSSKKNPAFCFLVTACFVLLMQYGFFSSRGNAGLVNEAENLTMCGHAIQQCGGHWGGFSLFCGSRWCDCMIDSSLANWIRMCIRIDVYSELIILRAYNTQAIGYILGRGEKLAPTQDICRKWHFYHMLVEISLDENFGWFSVLL